VPLLPDWWGWGLGLRFGHMAILLSPKVLAAVALVDWSSRIGMVGCPVFAGLPGLFGPNVDPWGAAIAAPAPGRLVGGGGTGGAPTDAPGETKPSSPY